MIDAVPILEKLKSYSVRVLWKCIFCIFLQTFCLLDNKYSNRQHSSVQGQPNAIINFVVPIVNLEKHLKFERWQQSVVRDVIAQASRVVKSEEVLQSFENESDF